MVTSEEGESVIAGFLSAPSIGARTEFDVPGAKVRRWELILDCFSALGKYKLLNGGQEHEINSNSISIPHS